MKILFITSFYSAVKLSVNSNSWNPSGMPAITKLFERLHEKSHRFDNIYIERSDNSFKINENLGSRFNNKIIVISLSNKLNIKFFRYLKNTYNSLVVLYYSIMQLFKNHYDLVYIDRANIFTGAILSFFKYKVILRLHGVTDFYYDYNKFFFKILHPITLLGLKYKFNHIICSNDGSPGLYFLKQFTNHKRSTLLLNGVNKHINNKSDIINRKNLLIPDNTIVFLFVGRLTNDKGIIDFLNAMLDLKLRQIDFFAIIIGEGLFHTRILKSIESNNLNNILLLPKVNYMDIHHYYNLSDVYVSLNKLGNLSNTVLEAINAEMCIVTLDKSKKLFKDISTYNLLKDSVLYVNREKLRQSLYEIFNFLLDDHSNILKMKNKIKKPKKLLNSWDIRIDREIKILKES